MKKLLYEKHFDDNINEDAEEIFNYLYDPVNLFNDSDTIYILFGGVNMIRWLISYLITFFKGGKECKDK